MKNKHVLILSLIILAVFMLKGQATALKIQASDSTTRVSVASDGTQGNNDSGFFRLSLSTDGRYVAFQSKATNLVSNDTNGEKDVFIHDRQTGQTTRISVASDGTQGNSWSDHATISTDGRFITFASHANNLVSNDTNDKTDIFVHDQQTGTTTRVSVSSAAIQGNGNSYAPSISADNRYVSFYSVADNLILNDTNENQDIFVHDLQTGQTTRVSIASDSTQGNNASWASRITANGRYVAFQSEASNLVSGDSNGKWDIFVHDRQIGETTRVSVASNGTQGNANSDGLSISADGRYIVFESEASNLVNNDTNGRVDIFVHDQQTGQTARISVASDSTEGNNDSYEPSISANGRYIIFSSKASNLVNDDTNSSFDTFVHDQQTGTTTRVSVASDGTEGNDKSFEPTISADGRFVAFGSFATNLVSGDTNDFFDVFVHDRDGSGGGPLDFSLYLPIVVR